MRYGCDTEGDFSELVKGLSEMPLRRISEGVGDEENSNRSVLFMSALANMYGMSVTYLSL